MTGQKHDEEKIRYSLVPWGPMEEVVRVLEKGAEKYSEENWKRVENGRQRYLDAAVRHVIADLQGEKFDNETDERHLAHAVCNLLFALWFDDHTPVLNTWEFRGVPGLGSFQVVPGAALDENMEPVWRPTESDVTLPIDGVPTRCKCGRLFRAFHSFKDHKECGADVDDCPWVWESDGGWRKA